MPGKAQRSPRQRTTQGATVEPVGVRREHLTQERYVSSGLHGLDERALHALLSLGQSQKCRDRQTRNDASSIGKGQSGQEQPQLEWCTRGAQPVGETFEVSVDESGS